MSNLIVHLHRGLFIIVLDLGLTRRKNPAGKQGSFFYVKLEVECPKSPKRQSNIPVKGFSKVPPKAGTIPPLSLYNKGEYTLVSA